MAGAIHDADILMAVGDSTSHVTTSWISPNLITAINAGFVPAAATHKPGRSTGAVASATGVAGVNNATALPGAITFIDAGVNGDTIAGLDAIITGLLITNAPSDLVIGTGTNDVNAGTTPANFETSLNSVLAKCAAWNSGRLRVWIREIFFRGEIWAAGPSWNNGAVDAAVDAINAKMVTCAAGAGATFIPLRAATLVQEVISNPSKLASGIFSSDGIHPNGTGRALFSTLALPAFVISE